MENKEFSMETYIKVFTKTIKKMGKENTYGVMGQSMKAGLLMTTSNIFII